MANPAHLARIYEGVDAWNVWRATSGSRPDLRHAPLGRSSLAGYNLAGADCREAIFENSDLSGCEFGGANLGFANLRGARVSGASFSDMSFFQADLTDVDFAGATIDTVNFQEAKLERAVFGNTHIRFCDFARANLLDANFSDSVLCHVDLENADIRRANFRKAKLTHVNLDKAWIWETKTTDWELTNVECHTLKTGRDGDESAFTEGQFEETFATRTIRVQLPGDQEPFEAVDLQNLIYHIGKIDGSFSIALNSEQEGQGGPLRETTIKIDPHSPVQASEVEKLKSIISGLRELHRDKDNALETLRMSEASLKDKLVSVTNLMPWGGIGGDTEEKERLTVAMFDLTGSSGQSERESIAATAKFWGIGVPLVKDRKGRHLNTWGDALVVCFDNVETALDSAWELIVALQAISIRCRAGIHHGDVWIRYNPLIARKDIAGPTVHLAARLEPQADACSVLVSREVRDLALALKLDRFEFQDKQITFQKGAGTFAKGDTYLASIAVRKHA
ncbi:MAG TPA: pentapeptide repeat-containing protein [Pyrinomonadaceae bacterium]|nr:pentapeptide repeat-containing protein [Pyrinomonadaceae bacterium]